MSVRLKDLQAMAAIVLLLASGNLQMAGAQAAQSSLSAPVSGNLPAAPAAGNQPSEAAPKLTEPLYLRDTGKDYTHLKPMFPNPFKPYTRTGVDLPRLNNTPRLDSLIRDGKIYLSLSDAVLLALENNFDIAIARINLDIADTDILRSKAGAGLRGVSTGLVANTLGGSGTTVTGGGGPGGTTGGSGGGGAGANGLVLSTNGGGPAPENLDPTLTGTLQYETLQQQQSNLLFSGGKSVLSTNTSTYNFGYTQGFLTGTQLGVTYNNSRVTSDNPFVAYSPDITTSFRATATQHLLQGFGWGINGRFIVQAKNDRRITDSAFRQQLLYTVNQVENIYWGLVSAYEDEQAKERALAQSTQLTSDNRKQLEIGTLAPLDVVNSDSAVATDKQALVASQSNLTYQQLLMKQAIVRNLEDPVLTNAPVIPTDRVGLDRLPEEDMTVDALVQQAYVNNPQIEQAVLSMKNNEITMKAEKNGLLPTVDAYAFYGSSQLSGAQNPSQNCNPSFGSSTFVACTPSNGGVSSIGYGTAFGNLFNSSAPDKGMGVNVTIPLRNRVAQADQARSQMEYRQAQMRLQQLYTQIRIQVINGQYALTNDRAQVTAAQAGRDYATQSLDAEQKKFKLGASTSALVLQQQRNLATAENALISATAAYAKDRAALLQLLSNTLDRYGISIPEAASGTITAAPVIPGLTAPTAPAAVKPISVGPAPASQPAQ
ncbi:MAG TPA: TolC family protein [Acidobacteriaceae bacterium]|nr:TolC family protein [Acidobacteriaceae bacterium]